MQACAWVRRTANDGMRRRMGTAVRQTAVHTPAVDMCGKGVGVHRCMSGCRDASLRTMAGSILIRRRRVCTETLLALPALLSCHSHDNACCVNVPMSLGQASDEACNSVRTARRHGSGR